MKTTKNYITTINLCMLCGLLGALQISNADAAAVVSRQNRPSAAASRMPTMAARAASSAESSNTGADTSEYTAEEIAEIEESLIIEDKSSQFDEVLSDTTNSGETNNSTFADRVRAQRDAMDAQLTLAKANSDGSNSSYGGNACDMGLRSCMKAKCGDDYSQCAGDTDTLWGSKMDTCRLDLKCTGEEYRLFTTEIKADRDMNARVASYTAIVDCGNKYNDCIITECGTTFSKCLGKSAGDRAIEKCSKIAKNCTEQDSGLSSRTMNVFGNLRQDAEKQVQKDEQRLYTLRDEMRGVCQRLGALFDERTLDCVFTVEFYAGEGNTLFASKKAYAGSSFSCNQNWFGIDVTTFKENAYRLTREQKAASSAMLGAGLGTAVGSITSGALDRAIDRHKAEKAVKDAQGNEDKIAKKEAKELEKQQKKAKKECDKKTGYKWNDNTKECEAINNGGDSGDTPANQDGDNAKPANQDGDNAKSAATGGDNAQPAATGGGQSTVEKKTSETPQSQEQIDEDGNETVGSEQTNDNSPSAQSDVTTEEQ